MRAVKTSARARGSPKENICSQSAAFGCHWDVLSRRPDRSSLHKHCTCTQNYNISTSGGLPNKLMWLPILYLLSRSCWFVCVRSAHDTNTIGVAVGSVMLTTDHTQWGWGANNMYILLRQRKDRQQKVLPSNSAGRLGKLSQRISETTEPPYVPQN